MGFRFELGLFRLGLESSLGLELGLKMGVKVRVWMRNRIDGYGLG